MFTVFDRTLDLLLRRSTVQVELSPIDDFEEVASKIGKENRSWLEELCHGVQIQQEPITASDGEIVAEPLFWFKNGSQVVACFERDSTTTHIQHRVEDFGGRVIFPGDQVGLINSGTKLDGDIYPGFKSDVQIPQNNVTPSNCQASSPKPVSPTSSLVKKTSPSWGFSVKSFHGAWQVVNTKTGEIVSTTNIKDSAEKRARELNGQHADIQKKNIYTVRLCSGGWQVVDSTTGELILTTNVQQNALDRAKKLNGK